MNPKDKAEAQAREAMASVPVTKETVTTMAPVFASREELGEAMQEQGWAWFVSGDDTHVTGVPRGNPSADCCPCCSGIDAVEVDGERMITAEVSIYARSACWGQGPVEDRGFTIMHQRARKDLEEVFVRLGSIPPPEEALRILEECAWEREERQQREAAVAESRMAIEEALDRAGYGGLYAIGEPEHYFLREDGLAVQVEGEVDGEQVDFYLDVRTKADEDSGTWVWEHEVSGDAPAEIYMVSVRYRSRPGVIPAPARVQRDLDKRRDEAVAEWDAWERFQEYLEAEAESGPGQEPDMEAWRQQVHARQQAERERRKRLDEATGARRGMFGEVTDCDATGTTLAYCTECGGDTSTGFLKAADEGEELSFRPIHRECLEELYDERFEGSTLPEPDDLQTFAVYVKEKSRDEGDVLVIPYVSGPEPTS